MATKAKCAACVPNIVLYKSILFIKMLLFRSRGVETMLQEREDMSIQNQERFRYYLVGTTLDHHGHDFIDKVSSQERCELSLGVVCRSDLNDIGANQVVTIQTTQDIAHFSGQETAGFGSASGRCHARVNDINVDRQIHQRVFLGAQDFMHAFNNAIKTELEDIVCLDHAESKSLVAGNILFGVQGRADTNVHGCTVGGQTFTRSVVERVAVVENGGFGLDVVNFGCPVNCRFSYIYSLYYLDMCLIYILPCIQVRIKVDDSDWLVVSSTHGPQNGQEDGVVTTQSDELGRKRSSFILSAGRTVQDVA